MILLTLTAAFALSLGVGYVADDMALEAGARPGWWWSIGIAFALSVLCWYLGRRHGKKIFRREAMAVIGLGWIAASIVGALPYMFIVDASLANAIFESASGLTTTGASVFPGIDEFPKSLLFWRCLSQWIGGLGVVVFFVAILSFLGAGAKILYSNEASAKSTELESSRVQSGVLGILSLYLALSALCALTYRLFGMTWYDAVCHMFATLSTGGFSTHGASIAHFNNPLIEWAAIFFMALGGTSFLYMLKLFRVYRSKGNLFNAARNTEVFVYYGIIAFTTAMLTILLFGEWGRESFHDALRHSAFQVVSILTTTGFGSSDFEQWPAVGHVMLLTLMAIGGCSGSTGGGIKVIRLIVTFKVVMQNIEKSFRTRIVRPLHIDGRAIPQDDQQSVMAFVGLAAVMVFVSLPFIGVFEQNMSVEGVFSATLACLFNIGPGFAEVGPTDTYEFMAPPTKLFLSLLMIMGRIEFYAILVLFIPSLWKKY